MTRAFNNKMVLRTMGALLLIEAVFMTIAMGVSWWYNDPDDGAFLTSVVITLTCGVLALLAGHNAPNRMGEREGYVIVACVWLIFSVFGMLPYYLSGQISTITDAWFETMSGFTTTGATILNDVECLTHGALFWRAVTQWLGGCGIIVLSIAILPIFGLNGMQLYAAEVTGVQYEKISPRIADTSKHIWLTYMGLTITEAVLLWIEGMNGFDSVCHSLTTVATGGFSTKNASIAYFDNPWIHYTITIAMLLSSINFATIVLFFRGRFRKISQDEEAKWFLSAVAAVTLLLTIGLMVRHWFSLYGGFAIDGGEATHTTILLSLEESFRTAIFTTVATMTSTGFAIADYTKWASLLWVTIFFMMFMGGSSGSTAGGIKWVRTAIFLKSGVAEFKRRIHPNAVIPVKINGRPISQHTTNNVMAFMVFYIVIVIISTLLFCALGVNFDEALGASVSAMGNIGPSIGQYGPAGTYATFPEIGKWIMTIVMLIGRLEIFTVLLLFSRVLWKK
ncbi:MAG: TrkH family potassium uptake protein [Paludibacteraceae bacterium]|nr:TrkH family potassium uptake protein [Paludibacteraceae bacterium]